jgi:hypothetical protein
MISLSKRAGFGAHRLKTVSTMLARNLYDVPNPKKPGPSGKAEVFDAKAAVDERLWIKDLEEENKLIIQNQKKRQKREAEEQLCRSSETK